MTVLINLKKASASSRMEDNGRLNKRYKHTYLYRTDAGTRPTFADIDADMGIAPGSPYGDDLTAVAGAIDIDHLDTRPPHCAAEVTVEWATNNPTAPEGMSGTNPITGRVLWGLRTLREAVFTALDRNGEMILNGAKQPFDGGVPVDLRIGQAEAKVDIDDADFDYASVYRDSGSLNSETYLGAEPGTLQVEIDAEEHVEGAAHFWTVRYSFTYKETGWQPQVANAGFYCRKPGGGAGAPLVRITEAVVNYPDPGSNNSMPEPEPLYDDGFIVPIANRPEDCNFVNVDWFPTKDFADFNLI